MLLQHGSFFYLSSIGVGKKVSGAFCAKHLKGRSGKTYLTLFSLNCLPQLD